MGVTPLMAASASTLLLLSACTVYAEPCELRRERTEGVVVCFEYEEPECTCDGGVR